MSHQRLPNEEIARLGEAAYEQTVRALVEPQHRGDIVAINVENGDFALGRSAIEASRAIFTKQADAQIWFVRVGELGVHRIGFTETERGYDQR